MYDYIIYKAFVFSFFFIYFLDFFYFLQILIYILFYFIILIKIQIQINFYYYFFYFYSIYAYFIFFIPILPKYNVITYKSVLAAYLTFGLERTIQMVSEGNKDISLKEKYKCELNDEEAYIKVERIKK